MGLRRDRFVEGSRLGSVLGPHVCLALSDPSPPDSGALDRRAELVARRVERSELGLGAEDGYRHRSILVVPQVVVVEVHAVRLSLELESQSGRLAR